MVAEARWGRLVLWRLFTVYAIAVNTLVLLTMLNDNSTPVNKSVWNFGYVSILISPQPRDRGH